VAQASSAAAVSAIGAVMRRGESAQRVVDRTARGLFLIGALPCIAAAILGPLVLPAILGASWAGVGTAVMALAAGAWAQFCVAPLSQVLNMGGHSSRLLVWDVARLVLLGAALIVPSLAGQGITTALGWFSAAQVLLYGVLFWLVRKAAAAPRFDARAA
jgi:O-antigen/teichoic acid export membrane protein